MAARSKSIIKSYGGLVVPATGIYAGAEDQDKDRNFTGPKGIETQMGRRMAIRRRHYKWLEPNPSANEVADAKLTNPNVISMVCQSGLGSFPVVTSGAWGSTNTAKTKYGQGIDRITGGEFDGFFVAAAKGLLALKRPVLYNLFYEYNGIHNNYYALAQGTVGPSLGNPGTGEVKYQKAWQHIWQLFNSAGATLAAGGNVIFCWTAQGPTTQGWYQNYYPGDTFVDWIGLDLYRATFAARATNPATWNGGTGSQDYYLFAQKHSKPFFIAEAGYRDAQRIADIKTAGGDGNAYDKDGKVTGNSAISKLLADLKTHPDTVAYVHWNELGAPALSGTGNYVDTSAKALQDYKTFYGDPYCGLTYKGSQAPPPQSAALVFVTTPTVKSGDTTRSTSAAFVWKEVTGAKYEVKLDTPSAPGRWLGQGFDPTCGIVGPLPAGTYTLQARIVGDAASAATWLWKVVPGDAPVFVTVPDGIGQPVFVCAATPPVGFGYTVDGGAVVSEPDFQVKLSGIAPGPHTFVVRYGPSDAAQYSWLQQ